MIRIIIREQLDISVKVDIISFILLMLCVIIFFYLGRGLGVLNSIKVVEWI
jgi:hypothetical protein